MNAIFKEMETLVLNVIVPSCLGLCAGKLSENSRESINNPTGLHWHTATATAIQVHVLWPVQHTARFFMHYDS